MKNKETFRLLFILCFATVFSVSVFGQSVETDLKKSFNKFSVVKINNREALRKAKSGTPLKIRFDDKNFQFVLKFNDVRSADYKSEYTDKDGRHSLPKGEVFTYQGTIVGQPHSLVALTVDGTKTEGYFATEAEGFFIESAKNYSSRAADNEQVIYSVKDKVAEDDNVCGLDEAMAEGMERAISDAAFNTASNTQTGGRRILEVATEADKEYVLEPNLGNGDPAKANAHILSVMNQVDAVYRRDLNLRVVVTFQHAWIPGTEDPYKILNSPNMNSNSIILNVFRLYWNTNFPASNQSYRRDVAFLFTRKITPSRGAAYDYGTVCNPENSYSYLNSDLGYSNWSAVAHEIGHNLGASHTFEQNPIPPNCTFSIMGQSVSGGFCQFSIDQITNYINIYGRSCLELDSSVSAPSFDFDGDGRADISVFRPSNGFWYVMKSSGGFLSTQWGLAADNLVPGDYDGDGKTDLAVHRKLIPFPETGTWYVLKSEDFNYFGRRWASNNIGEFDRPVPADYDGDGKTDLAYYRSTDLVGQPATYFVLRSSSNTGVSVDWGSPSLGDRPVPADYDGDGKADYAVYRNGTWLILQSSNGLLKVEYFGLPTDKVVPGDFDGDKKADIAVWRPSNGLWYYIKSSGGAFNGSFVSVQFGASSDKPVPADYDGDGKTDIAVFRPSNGVWYLLKSTEGFSAQQFGFGDDIPIPNVFVRQTF